MQRVTGIISLASKCSKRETDHCFAYSAEAKNGEAITSLPHTSSWRGDYLMKPRLNCSYTVVLLSEEC
jgi:hypothetical protein